jgi:hypothetical protein
MAISIGKYRRPAQQVAAFSELGSSGLKTSSGRIREEFLSELQGTNGVRIYKQMRDNDSTIGAILFAVGMLIRQAKWTVYPFEENNAADQTVAEFVQTCLDDMSMTWPDMLSEVLSMLPFGWAYLELIYKKRTGYLPNNPGQSSKYIDSLIGWRKMPIRAQDTLEKWEMDPEGGVKGMHQKIEGGKSVFIPVTKALLFRTETTKNNPEGRSILRNSYTSWYFKKRIQEIEGTGIERDLAGLPVIQPPEGVDIWDPLDPKAIAIRREAEMVVQNIRRDEQEGVVLPNGWELTLLSTGGKRNFDTTTIISRYDTAMAMTVLADFIILGHNNRYGSFALAGSKTHMFGVAIGGWLNSIKEVFNRYAIPRLLSVNAMDVTRPPRLDYSDIEVPDLDALGKYIANLQKSGFKLFPNIPLEKKLLEYANLPTEGMLLGQESDVAEEGDVSEEDDEDDGDTEETPPSDDPKSDE